MQVYRYTRAPAPPRRPETKVVNYRVKLISAVNSMPPLPVVLNRVLGMLSDDRASAAQIAALIEKDSVLSGSVLRCINSAYYSVQTRVSSIRHAVTLLGFATVRNLALAFSMRRMMSKNQPSKKLYSAYSRHALGCAVMTQFLAVYKRSDDLEAAFAAGLFHDVGKLLVLTTFPDVMPEIVKKWDEQECSWYEAEQEILDITHTELSEIVLEGWKLPDVIRNAARWHHDPASFPGAEPGDHNLARLVQAADAAVKSQGLEVVASPKRRPESPDEILTSIGLGDNVPELLAKFQKEFEGLQSIFS